MIAPTVKKIAILNPYLQGGHLETAEIESARRFAIAAKKKDIDVKVFASSDEVSEFDPDFVIPITYQEPKLTQYPTYGLVTMPVSWVSHIPRFVRNILSYDGYITPSETVIEWLKMLGNLNHKKIYVANSAFSIQETTYTPCDFSKAVAAYIGTNWDKSRHRGLFQYLTNGKYLKCFGPKKSWEQYSKTLYGGEIPFDGISTINVYQQHGIGLCINHSDFDKEGIPSSRTFEIAASSAIAICSENEYTESIFGDSVLYVDHSASTGRLSKQIIEAVEFIRSNPTIAERMAQRAHQHFTQQISMEIFLDRILEMHENILAHKGYTLNETGISDEKVVFLITVNKHNFEKLHETIASLKQQLYRSVEWVLIYDEDIKHNISFDKYSEKKYFKLNSPNLENDIKQYLLNSGTTWFGLINAGDQLFKQHVKSILNLANDTSPSVKEKLLAVQNGCLAKCNDRFLPDDIKDESLIKNEVHSKIYYLPQHTQTDSKLLLRSCLFQLKNLNSSLFQEFDFSGNNETLDKKLLESFGNIQESANLTVSFNFNPIDSSIKSVA